MVLDTIRVTVKAFAEGHIELEPVPVDTREGYIRQAPGFTPGRGEHLLHVYTAITLGEFLGWLDADGYASNRILTGLKDAKEARGKRIFEMWLACHTQEEIAAAEGIDQGDMSRMAKGFMEIGNLAESHRAAAAHATDFEPPIYNIWKQQKKTAGSNPACWISLGSGLSQAGLGRAMAATEFLNS